MSSLVNISIDDVSPHPRSSIKVLDRCYELIKVFPDIKFSLFVPLSYWRTIKPGIATKHPLQINFFKDFCDQMNKLSKDNFEICYHGFFHGIPGKSDNDEFQYLNYDQAVERFKAMFHVAKLANVSFEKIFRPPAWRMSPDAIKASKDMGIEILALSPKKYAKDIYRGEDIKFGNVVYYNVNPPFEELNIFPKTEIVYHACEWDKNYLSVKMKDDLLNFLKNQEDLKFCFLKDLC